MPNTPDEQEMPKKLRLLIKAKNSYLEQQQKNKTHNGPMNVQRFNKSEDMEDPNLLDSTKHMGYAIKYGTFFYLGGSSDY